MAALVKEGSATPIPLGRPSQNLGNPFHSHQNIQTYKPRSIFDMWPTLSDNWDKQNLTRKYGLEDFFRSIGIGPTFTKRIGPRLGGK